MAGPYADLSTYQRAAAQPVANPLESLIQGFQTGQQIQRLPQTLQEQEIMRQLNLALAQQKLQDVLNPNAALAREVQQQLAVKGLLNPATGIENAPVGLEGEIIGTPRAIASTAAELAAGAPVTSAAPGLPTTPISVGGIQTGFNLNPTAARTYAQQTLNDKIALANAKAAEQGIPVTYKEGANGEILAIPSRSFGGVTPTATAVKTSTGETAKAAPKASRGGLTENQKSSILNRVGRFGGEIPEDISSLTNEDYQRLSISAGRAEREELDKDRDAKLSAVPAEARSKVAAYQAVQKDLQRLRDKLEEEQASGDIPSAVQDLISASLAEAPTNFLSRTFQRFVLQPAQTKTAAGNERLRGAVAASIGRAIAGAALTGTEKQNLIPFTPQPGDSFERLLDKASGLEQFLSNQIEGLTAPIPIGTPNAPIPQTGTPVGTKVGRFTVTPVNR